MSKSKHDNNTCYMTKYVLKASFEYLLSKYLGTALQSVLIKNFLLNMLSWNFCKHKIIKRASFLC